MIYQLIKRVITSGNYDVGDMQNKLDVYLLYNRITQEQYEELTAIVTPE